MPSLNKEVDDDLKRLESDIRQFKIEYEQFFGGGRKRPPNDTEWRIERVLQRYGDRGAELNYAQRFRYGNLAQNYARLRDVMRKRGKRVEEGTVQRHFGAAARNVEKQREARRKEQGLPAVSVTCSDPAREPRKVEQIYSAMREAIESTGESSGKLSRDEFKDFLRQKTNQLRAQKGSAFVEFVVSVEGGKPRLRARVLDAQGSEKS